MVENSLSGLQIAAGSISYTLASGQCATLALSVKGQSVRIVTFG